MPQAGPSRARETEERKFIFSTADACDFFQISRETLSTWQKKGAPKYARGKWDIKAVMEWRYAGRHAESPETRKLKAEADLKEAKAAQEKIKLGVTKDEFVPADAVRAELTRLFANLKKSPLCCDRIFMAVFSDYVALRIIRKFQLTLKFGNLEPLAFIKI